tara:strand:- start:24 stop:311 length:288 start_codon:yes stop_codon:yes gene_type:complete
MSSFQQEMGTDCGNVIASLVIKWADSGADPAEVLECVALSIGSILVDSKVLEPDGMTVRTITAAEAGDMVAEFVEDGFKSTRLMMLEEVTGNSPK